MGDIDLSIPLGRGLILLNGFLPAIFWFGAAIARRVVRDALAARITGFGVAIGAWVLCTHVFGRVTHSLSAGLVLSTVALGTCGAALAYRDWRGSPRFRRSWRELSDMLIFALLLTIPVAVIAWRWAFWDEIGPSGHQAMIATIQRGYYPPRSLSFPQYELHYHYGFDLLCAMLTALFRVSIVRSIDLASIALWFYCVLISWVLGERVIRRGAGPLVALLMLLGGGFPWTCRESIPQAIPIAFHFLAFCEQGRQSLNPNIVSYFFQHPWTLGLPLALTVLVIESEPEADGVGWKRGTLVVLCTALYLAEVAAFLGVLCAVCASQLLAPGEAKLRDRVLTCAALLASAAVAVSALGGFFGGEHSHASSLELHWGIADTMNDSLWWTLKTFGVPLLGFIGLLWLPKRRLIHASLALGGIVVVNTVRYKLSWDIVKFATVSSVGLALPFAALIVRLQRSHSRPIGQWLPTCLVLPAIASSVAFLVMLAFDLPGVPDVYRTPQPTMTTDSRAAAEYLRTVMPADAVMYRRSEDYLPYMMYAGLPQVWINEGFALDRALAPQRTRLLESLPMSSGPYLEERVRFFVLDDGDLRLGAITNEWIARGKARLLKKFGSLRVIELLPNPNAMGAPRA